MKRKLLLLAMAGLVLSLGVDRGYAAKPAPKTTSKAKPSKQEESRQKLVTLLDTDGNGELSPQEMSKGLENPDGMRATKDQVVAKFDVDSSGKLDKVEQNMLNEAIRHRKNIVPGEDLADLTAADGKAAKRPDKKKEELLKQFDANGDGELDGKERAAIKEANRAEKEAKAAAAAANAGAAGANAGGQGNFQGGAGVGGGNGKNRQGQFVPGPNGPVPFGNDPRSAAIRAKMQGGGPGGPGGQPGGKKPR